MVWPRTRLFDKLQHVINEQVLNWRWSAVRWRIWVNMFPWVILSNNLYREGAANSFWIGFCWKEYGVVVFIHNCFVWTIIIKNMPQRKFNWTDGLFTYVRKKSQCVLQWGPYLNNEVSPNYHQIDYFSMSAGEGASTSQFQHGAKNGPSSSTGPVHIWGPTYIILYNWI